MPKDSQASAGRTSDTIREVRERFNQAIATHDAQSIAEVLVPNYHLVTGRSAQFHGAEDERIRWAELFAKDATVVYRRTPREIRVNEEWGLAEELGNWTGSYTAGARLVSALGVYAAKWQRAENGKWLLQAEIFTTLECNGPAEGCAPPDPIID